MITLVLLGSCQNIVDCCQGVLDYFQSLVQGVGCQSVAKDFFGGFCGCQGVPNDFKLFIQDDNFLGCCQAVAREFLMIDFQFLVHGNFCGCQGVSNDYTTLFRLLILQSIHCQGFLKSLGHFLGILGGCQYVLNDCYSISVFWTIVSSLFRVRAARRQTDMNRQIVRWAVKQSYGC